MTSILSLGASPRVAFEAGDPKPIKSMDEARAEWKAANRANLTPQEALRSGAELGPANSTNSLASNHVSKVHTEIKVDGKVIARVYNGGAVEIANEYSFLTDELGSENDTTVGPDLAVDRANRIKAALQKYGAVMKDELSLTDLLTAKLAQTPVLELLRAQTAQTQEEWQDEVAKQGPLDPGTFYSRLA